MARLRRKTLHRVLEIGALGMVALDLLFYLVVAHPLADGVKDQQQRFAEARLQVRFIQSRIGQAQDELNALPSTEEAMKQFLKVHVPPRQRSYSRAAGLVHKLTDDSNVQLKHVAYRLTVDPKEPLERLGIQANVQGPFEGLLKFAHELETTDDLLLVRGVILQPGDNGGLGLRMLAELYVTP
ncbi:MAG TPA: hypothetical protein VGZ29_09590 [Terriglobia bacterium]|nr:hypothetical protein [Terriglobia bacterium]